jgi:hypothetical protein
LTTTAVLLLLLLLLLLLPLCVGVQVVEGYDVVEQIEGQKVGPGDRPVNQCRIADCGEL